MTLDAHPVWTPFARHLMDPSLVGELPQADWIGEAGSLGQGELIRLYAVAAGERLTDVRFMAFGCAATLAAASAVTELIHGKTLAEMGGIGAGEIAVALGGLRQDQAHGAHLAHQALLGLLADARGEVLPILDSPLVCTCYRVTEAALRQAIGERHLTTVADVSAATLAGKGCGSCHGEILTMIAAQTAPKSPKPRYVPVEDGAALTLQQKASRVMDELERLRPILQAHGCDALLVDLQGDTYYMRFLGQVAPDGQTPLVSWVETQLRLVLGPDMTVEVSA